MGDIHDKPTLFFNDVLDNVALYYVIEKEYNAAMDAENLLSDGSSCSSFSSFSDSCSEEDPKVKVQKSEERKIKIADKVKKAGRSAKRERTLSNVLNEQIAQIDDLENRENI